MQLKRLKNFFTHKLQADYAKFSFALAVLWFSIRVIPKPSRISYPCQRATLGLLSVKLGIIFSTLLTSTTSIVNRKSVKTLSVLVLAAVLLWDPLTLKYYEYNFANSSTRQLTLSAIAYGFPNNRVVRVHSNTATDWDFNSAISQYWEHTNQTAVDSMVERGVMELTGTSTPAEAWNTIISGYAAGQKVGIKINGNDWWNTDDREIDSIPQVTNAIIRGLKGIGVPESDIRIIEDTYPSAGLRVIRPYYTNIVTAKYPNVVFQYATATSPTYGSVAGTTVNFPYSPSSRRINDQIASVDHLILIPIMKSITPQWGVTGSIKLMQGVIEGVGEFHSNLVLTTANNPDVLIYQNAHIIGKTRLIVGDGLFGAWTGQHFTGGYGGVDNLNTPVNDVPKPWITFNNGAPNSLFFSVDPVAIDSVMYDHILLERNAQDQVSGQTLAVFNEPQLLAGAAAGLGIREHGPPYTNIDYVEVELTSVPSTFHDVAVTNVVSSTAYVRRGQLVTVNVTLANQGSEIETFDVTVFSNQTVIGTQAGVSLAAADTQVLTFVWNTTSTPEGKYTLKAETSAVPNETDLADNVYVDGTVTVTPAVVHDVAVTSVSASPNTALPGDTVNVAVVVKNEGTQSETFTLSAYANTTLIGTRDVTLATDATTTEVFNWNTTGALGVYVIKAEASPVQGEIDIADNTRESDSAVAVFPYQVEFPTASFVYAPTAPLAGEDIAFNASSSLDPDGTIVSYHWNFGDGNNGTGSAITHRFSSNGNFTVTLTVVDNDGLFDKETESLIVRKNPKAWFTLTQAAPQINEAVTFNASLSTPEGGTIVSYLWDFGDGTQITKSVPVTTHAFSKAGNYIVTLTVTDSEGLSDVATAQVSVGATSIQPTFPIEIIIALLILALTTFAIGTALFFKRRSSLR